MFKLLRRFSVLFLIPFLFACDSNEEEDIASGAAINGTWNVESIDFNWTIDDIDAIQYLKDEFGFTDEQASSYDSLITASFAGSYVSITFDNSGEFTQSYAGTSETGNWSLNDDSSELTLTVDGTPDVYEVFTLSNSAFSFGIEETEMEDMNDDGVLETSVIQIIINLKR